MKYDPTFFDLYENTTGEPAFPRPTMKLLPGVKIIGSTILGPLYCNRFTQIGPESTIGKFTGFNEHCFAGRVDVGAYCAFGARTALNPFNHPVSWLSTNEFQYHPKSFDWVEEYRDLVRLERTPDMMPRATIGNDVWSGHNVNVLSGVTVGDGAILAAGCVVTQDVPPYAIVAGVPAKVVRYRFSDKVIERLLKIRWWDFELSQLSGLNFRDVESILPRLEEIRATGEE